MEPGRLRRKSNFSEASGQITRTFPDSDPADTLFHLYGNPTFTVSAYQEPSLVETRYPPPHASLKSEEQASGEQVHGNTRLTSLQSPLVRSHTLGTLPFVEDSWPTTPNPLRAASPSEAGLGQKHLRPPMPPSSSFHSFNVQNSSQEGRPAKVDSEESHSTFTGRNDPQSLRKAKAKAAKPGKVRGNNYQGVSADRSSEIPRDSRVPTGKPSSIAAPYSDSSESLAKLELPVETKPSSYDHLSDQLDPNNNPPSAFPSVDQVISQMTAAHINVTTPSGESKTLDELSTRLEKIEAITWTLGNERRYAGMSQPRVGRRGDPKNIGLLRPVKFSDFDNHERLRLYQQSQWSIALTREATALKAQLDQHRSKNIHVDSLFPSRTTSLAAGMPVLTSGYDKRGYSFSSSDFSDTSSCSVSNTNSSNGPNSRDTISEGINPLTPPPKPRTNSNTKHNDDPPVTEETQVDSPTPKPKPRSRSSSSPALFDCDTPTKSDPLRVQFVVSSPKSVEQVLSNTSPEPVNEPKPTSYWLGRMVALEDRVRTAALHGECPRKFMHNQDERRYACYDYLRKKCVNQKTSDNFAEFVVEWEAKVKVGDPETCEQKPEQQLNDAPKTFVSNGPKEKRSVFLFEKLLGRKKS
ncbi:MAG: hypothetical protein LQ342_007329 [Letrouitia transgressa]|nr:MAG: hypothetical protein LQ342_007329 [Letrouitia transgressa]